MAFHGHHLWDLRLWKVAGSSFTKTLQASGAIEGGELRSTFAALA